MAREHYHHETPLLAAALCTSFLSVLYCDCSDELVFKLAFSLQRSCRSCSNQNANQTQALEWIEYRLSKKRFI